MFTGKTKSDTDFTFIWHGNVRAVKTLDKCETFSCSRNPNRTREAAFSVAPCTCTLWATKVPVYCRQYLLRFLFDFYMSVLYVV